MAASGSQLVSSSASRAFCLLKPIACVPTLITIHARLIRTFPTTVGFQRPLELIARLEGCDEKYYDDIRQCNCIAWQVCILEAMGS